MVESLWKEMKVRAPVNIALVKYWGKRDQELILPLNDSVSLTVDALYAETHAKVFIVQNDDQSATKYAGDVVIVNTVEVTLMKMSRYKKCFAEVRRQLAKDYSSFLPKSIDGAPSKLRFEIVSGTNFPVSAGLASSAAGFAAIAYSLGLIFGFKMDDICRLARLGSGSAARSLFPGLSQWFAGSDPKGMDSLCKTLYPENHWPKLRCLVLVVSDAHKAYSSTDGMHLSVLTSEFLKFRISNTVPDHLAAIKDAFANRNFDQLARYVMRDSNQLHAVCMDTYPPLHYLNDTSKTLIQFVHTFNDVWSCETESPLATSVKNGCHVGKSSTENGDDDDEPPCKRPAIAIPVEPKLRLAYSFDAGPNCFLLVEDDFLLEVLSCLCYYFPTKNEEKFIRTASCSGIDITVPAAQRPTRLLNNMQICKNVIQYMLVSSVGCGPVVM